MRSGGAVKRTGDRFDESTSATFGGSGIASTDSGPSLYDKPVVRRHVMAKSGIIGFQAQSGELGLNPSAMAWPDRRLNQERPRKDLGVEQPRFIVTNATLDLS